MKVPKTAGMLLIFLFSTKVLCTNVTNDIKSTTEINSEETTTEFEPVTKQSNEANLSPSFISHQNTTVIKTNKNNTVNENTTNTEILNSSDIPKELEDLQPTNSSNFAYKFGTDNAKSNDNDTETSDLLNVPTPPVDYDLAPDNPSITYKPDDPVDTQIFLKDDSINVNLEGMKNFEATLNYKRNDMDHVALVPGTLAAILAGIFLVVSIAGYISLLTWRRYLENRYGNREMLVEDDYCEKNMNDLEHFSI